jgi:hypothetical protein
MKKWYYLFIILSIISIFTVVNAEVFKLNSSAKFQYDELIGIYAKDYLTLVLYMNTPLTGRTFPLTITLRADDTKEKDKKVMIIKELLDLPRKNVQTECPRSEKYKYKKCWFIKYEEDY